MQVADAHKEHRLKTNEEHMHHRLETNVKQMHHRLETNEEQIHMVQGAREPKMTRGKQEERSRGLQTVVIAQDINIQNLTSPLSKCPCMHATRIDPPPTRNNISGFVAWTAWGSAQSH